jgi:hypothetical protein
MPADLLPLGPREVAESLDELLAGAGPRSPYATQERRSEATFESVEIDGEPFVLKFLHRDDDFVMRSTGDPGSRVLKAYAAGLYGAAPDFVDHAVVGAARGTGRGGTGCAFLMRDVSAYLVPPGDDPLPDEQHAAFIRDLAGMCARTWGWTDDLGLQPYASRWKYFAPDFIESEAAIGFPEVVPRIARDGFERFAERGPRDVVDAVQELRRSVRPMVDRLRQTPSCFLHGDWKASNLGRAPDGRTALIDWVYLGEGPACHELAWYLSLNAAKLPTGRSKESVIEEFRGALETQGVATDGWWEMQVDLCLLGGLVQFAWEKALGGDEELNWWCDRARAGLSWI